MLFSVMSRVSRFLPREHGAYAQLGFPLATGLLLAFPPALSAVLLALAAILFFLANEPVSIVLGIRGARLKRQEGEEAKGRGRVLLGAAAVSGIWGFALGWPTIWPEILIPSLLAVSLIPLVLSRNQKTIPGELLVVSIFSSLVLPLAVASGSDPLRAGLAAGVWWISFALGTLEVHAIKARVKTTARSQWTRLASPVAAGGTVALASWLALGQASPIFRRLRSTAPWGSGGTPGSGGNGWGETGVWVEWGPELMRLLPPTAAALLPPALAIFFLSLSRVHPRHLKRVGWTLVGANTLTLVLLLQG